MFKTNHLHLSEQPACLLSVRYLVIFLFLVHIRSTPTVLAPSLARLTYTSHLGIPAL